LPVIEEQTDSHEQDTQDGSEQLRHSMAECMLKVGTILHDGGREVGKILLPKKSQWQPPQFFRQGYPAVGTLFIYGGIGASILEYRNHEHK
jgi:hypothetical protein